MDAFVSKKRPHLSPDDAHHPLTNELEDEESTDIKLALLASLHPNYEQEMLLEALLACEGSVEMASRSLQQTHIHPRKRQSTGSSGSAYQSSLTSYNIKNDLGSLSSTNIKKQLTKKGRTLHLYSPEDIEEHTPCTLIHNFLPAEQADALLRELLGEAPTYRRDTFKLFGNVVQSPHSLCFYVDSYDEAEMQKNDYVYSGNAMFDIRCSLPEMRKAAVNVAETVNREIQRRIIEKYPGGKKLKYQSPHEWKPNASFVNCYDGGAESLGYHSDTLTYVGPHPIIGSLSLGVAREFRVRRVMVRDDEQSVENDGNSSKKPDNTRADAQGQIAIHLPHNSLLIMHAEMQEEWKHSIAPAPAITPHPLAQNKRINITYREYKPYFHPKYTPRCKCDVPAALRCVQRKKENRGKYMWMCYTDHTPGQEGCSFFQWAEFDEDGDPPWAKKDSRLLHPDEPKLSENAIPGTTHAKNIANG